MNNNIIVYFLYLFFFIIGFGYGSYLTFNLNNDIDYKSLYYYEKNNFDICKLNLSIISKEFSFQKQNYSFNKLNCDYLLLNQTLNFERELDRIVFDYEVNKK